jgi:hypothetical protein
MLIQQNSNLLGGQKVFAERFAQRLGEKDYSPFMFKRAQSADLPWGV